jgi:hypothetical protein
MLPDALPDAPLPDALPDALPEALLPDALPLLPVEPLPPAMLPDVPVVDEDGRDIEPPDAPAPDMALARMKSSAFEASPAEAVALPPLAGCRHPVTVTLSSDCLPPACRLLLDCPL